MAFYQGLTARQGATERRLVVRMETPTVVDLDEIEAWLKGETPREPGPCSLAPRPETSSTSIYWRVATASIDCASRRTPRIPASLRPPRATR